MKDGKIACPVRADGKTMHTFYEEDHPVIGSNKHFPKEGAICYCGKVQVIDGTTKRVVIP